MFTTRWRWVSRRVAGAAALPRRQARCRRSSRAWRPRTWSRSVFPDQLACAENLAGEREIPDHPLVRQTIDDCLHEAMDIDGLGAPAEAHRVGRRPRRRRDLTQPSPLALEVLSARPYAFLDDAPLEERRTQAVMARRWLAPEEAADLGRLDPEAIARVRDEAWPDAANADELHDALVWLGLPDRGRGRRREPDWRDWLTSSRPTSARRCIDAAGATLWIAAERLPQFRALWPRAATEPAITAPAAYDKRMVARRGAGRDPARPAGRPGPGDRGRARRAARPAPDDDRRGAGGARGRRLRHARPLHAGGAERRMVRAPPAGAHPPLHGQAAARRDRAGRGARLPALPVPLAARRARRRRSKAPTRSTPSSASSKASRRRPAPGRARSCRRALQDYEPAWLDERCLAGPRHLGCGCAPRNGRDDGERGRRRCARRRSRCCRAAMPRSGGRWRRPAEPAQPSARGAGRRSISLRANGASFFDELVQHAACCARRSRRRWPSWSRSASSPPTASPACARCWCRRRAQAAAARAAAAPLPRHGGCRPLGAGAPPAAAADRTLDAGAVEHVARALLRRYGVVFWRLLEREAAGCRRGATAARLSPARSAAARSAAAASSPASPASSSRCPKRSARLREVRRRPRVRRMDGGVGRRSAQPRRHPDARAASSPRSPATACSIATACRSRPVAAARSASSSHSIPRPNGSPARRWCAARAAARRSSRSGPQRPTSRRPGPERAVSRVV